MQEFVHNRTFETDVPAAGRESRGAPRFALMLRSAKLIGDGTEFLCIIRDVSETGIKLRLFHPLPVTDVMMVETASGEHFPIEKMWQSKNEAGFRFRQPIDVDAFLSESGPYPKRPLRLAVCHPAEARIGPEVVPIRILDISRQGARIESHTKLAIGQKFRLEATELPMFEANVLWRRAPEYGVVFGQVMGLEELAQRASRMERAPCA